MRYASHIVTFVTIHINIRMCTMELKIIQMENSVFACYEKFLNLSFNNLLECFVLLHFIQYPYNL